MNVGWGQRPVFQVRRGSFEAIAAADQDLALVTDELNHLTVLDGMIFPHFRAVGINVRLKLRAVEAFGDELDRSGMVHAERPLDDVKVVGAPIAILAGTIIPE